MNLPPATYTAKPREASVYESKAGALMAAIVFDITSEGYTGQRITSHQCLAKKDGSLSDITIETFKQCFGWDGSDFFWIEDACKNGALAECEVELVIEEEQYQDNKTQEWKTSPKVRYINPIGGGSIKLPASADRNSVRARYGASLRALGGGAPKAPQPAPTAPPSQSQHPLPGVPAPSARPPSTAPAPTSTMDKAWEACCAAYQNMPSDQLEKVWFTTRERMFPGREKSMTGADWHTLVEAFQNDDVPF
jgi:hypothetical protein